MNLQNKLLIAGVSLIGTTIAVGFFIVRTIDSIVFDEEWDMDFGYDPITSKLDEDAEH